MMGKQNKYLDTDCSVITHYSLLIQNNEYDKKNKIMKNEILLAFQTFPEKKIIFKDKHISIDELMNILREKQCKELFIEIISNHLLLTNDDEHCTKLINRLNDKN